MYRDGKNKRNYKKNVKQLLNRLRKKWNTRIKKNNNYPIIKKRKSRYEYWRKSRINYIKYRWNRHNRKYSKFS